MSSKQVEAYVGTAKGDTLSISLPKKFYGPRYSLYVSKTTGEIHICKAKDDEEGCKGHMSTGDRCMLQFTGKKWHAFPKSALMNAERQTVVLDLKDGQLSGVLQLPFEKNGAKKIKRRKKRSDAGKPRLKKMMRSKSVLETGDKSTLRPVLIITGKRSQIDALEAFAKNAVGLCVQRTVVEV